MFFLTRAYIDLVELRGWNLNPDLARYLRERSVEAR
jgi:hypothetical protein